MDGSTNDGVATVAGDPPKPSFLEHLMSRVNRAMGAGRSQPPAEVTERRWSMPSKLHAIIFIGLARKYRLEVYRKKAARGFVVFTRGPAATHRDLKRFAWTPLVDTIAVSIEEIFRDTVATAAQVEFSPEVYDKLDVMGDEKPSPAATPAT